MSLTKAKSTSLADKLAAQETATLAELDAISKAKKRAQKED